MSNQRRVYVATCHSPNPRRPRPSSHCRLRKCTRRQDKLYCDSDKSGECMPQEISRGTMKRHSSFLFGRPYEQCPITQTSCENIFIATLIAALRCLALLSKSHRLRTSLEQTTTRSSSAQGQQDELCVQWPRGSGNSRQSTNDPNRTSAARQ